MEKVFLFGTAQTFDSARQFTTKNDLSTLYTYILVSKVKALQSRRKY